MAAPILDPPGHRAAWAMTVLYGGFVLLAYVTFRALSFQNHHARFAVAGAGSYDCGTDASRNVFGLRRRP